MEERVFKLTALTPVHIGTGETITPEEYFIQADKLVRINLHRILMEWPEGSRRRFEQLIAANQLEPARRMLRDAGCDPRYQLYQAAVGAAARQELQREDPARRSGEVHVLLRNLAAGAAVIPGSAIKGAIRTAIVNASAAYLGAEERESIKRRLDQDRKRAWMLLEELALEYPRERTERDPLRMLRVSDAELPPAAVRVDRVMVLNRQQREPEGRGIQLHVERLLSRADAAQPPSCTLRIALATELARDRRTGLKPLDWDFLIASCNYFFWSRYQEEIRQFGFLAGTQWVPEQLPAGGILLRIGRFSHFESLSVDGLRSGWNQQLRRPIEGMGSSRSLCVLNKERLAPFGWALLEPA